MLEKHLLRQTQKLIESSMLFLFWFVFCNFQDPQIRAAKTVKLHAGGKEPPPPDLSVFGLKVLFPMSSAVTLVVSNNYLLIKSHIFCFFNEEDVYNMQNPKSTLHYMKFTNSQHPFEELIRGYVASKFNTDASHLTYISK